MQQERILFFQDEGIEKIFPLHILLDLHFGHTNSTTSEDTLNLQFLHLK